MIICGERIFNLKNEVKNAFFKFGFTRERKSL